MHDDPISAQLEPSSRPQGRILVVDDDEEARYVYQAHLAEEGHDVACAATGGEALEMLQAQPFDLVITDLDMPEMNGFALIRFLVRLRPELPIFICTGVDMEAGLPDDVNEIIMGTLRKPVPCEQLSRAAVAWVRD
jgi:CheY-like chemotaxis protein